MRLSLHILSACAALCLVSCGGGNTSAPVSDTPATREFKLPQVPGMMSEEEQIDFVASRYWDAFTDTAGVWLCDSTHVCGVEKTALEQALSNYLYLLDRLPLKRSRNLIAGLYDKVDMYARVHSESNMFGMMKEIVDSYLYDPNSPMRNEDYYQPYVARLAADERVDSLERMKYSRYAAACLLNMVGTPAADFRFSDKTGHITALYGIKADYTLLFFSNPGCTACKEIIETLKASLRVQYLLENGILAVANVYIDEQLDEWYDYMSYYPEEWYNGFDHNHVIRGENLYDVRAIPSLYLLDRDKKVIFKDVPQDRLFAYLESL